jgi:fructose-1,6-bisphosphatase/inositol monophosphatase family enzyme
MRLFRDGPLVSTAQDLVSEADRACEDLIGARLSGLFPGDGFLGEERAAVVRFGRD